MNIDDQTKLDALRWRCLVRLATVEYHGPPGWDISLRLPVSAPDQLTATDVVDYILLSGHPALNKPRYKTVGDYTQYQPIGRVTEAALEGLGWTRELFGSLSSLDLAGQRWYAWSEGRVLWFSKCTPEGKLEPSRTFTLEYFSTTFPT